MKSYLAKIGFDFLSKLMPIDKFIQLFNRANEYLESLDDQFYHSNIGSHILELYDNNDREEILHLAPQLLDKILSPNDREVLIEILINSSVVYGRHEFIKQLLSQLGRVDEKKAKIYKAKYYQAKGDYETAFKLMTGILIRYPTDIIIRKQTLATLKNRIPIDEYIDLINRHLCEFPLDTESWQELGELYISSGKINEAIYCYNEVILHEPNNIFYIITIADLNYTIARFPLSYKYYSAAVTLNCMCTRALWGLVLVYTRIVRNSKDVIENTEDPQHKFSDVHVKVARKALQLLRGIYIKSRSYAAVRALNRLWNEWDAKQPVCY
ncbi:ER membrane protein complex subunit 2-B [Babesia microti strain RI]|uniref:ER membrane protein complex subunit 2 n=1 Tax=Babesia microti (strain RI) TaxID=1133968 RepID=A0A1N6LX75_BABMR|nr:ER membrane protein complex subunit 2-B [Babesia microti strain RI]SIO73464.1 ER membrane protein complex subunit 2-B [Babesia microti strain RI]|eukprot:XP_021337560.1 ER membrane protein complex subunit 2-B [Babesia microti strain RI]